MVWSVSSDMVIIRPPISSTKGRYESPRSIIEIKGLSRAAIKRNCWTMNVFPPPDFAITSMFASLKPGSKSEKGMSWR